MNLATGIDGRINRLLNAGEGNPYPSSFHPGGVNTLMCDGSARFLNEDMDTSVYYRLLSPAGSKAHGPIIRQPIVDENSF